MGGYLGCLQAIWPEMGGLTHIEGKERFGSSGSGNE